jgi:hypothetical protein
MASKSEVLRVLLRSAGEVAYRFSCVRTYLVEVKAVRPEYDQLVNTLEAAIDGIEGLIPETFDSVQKALTAAGAEEQALDVLLSFLKRFSRWFVKIHELLVYLPRGPVAPEIGVTLSATFGSRYKQHPPSVILGSVFNASEWDFFERMQRSIPDLENIRVDPRENVVLELAVCDRFSPHAWPILAHEMGHAIDEAEDISTRVAHEFVKDPNSKAFEVVASWCAEACSDLIAARVMGPTPMLALLGLEYCWYPLAAIHQESESHPATQWRLNVVSAYLERITGLDLLSKERELYESATRYSRQRDPRNTEEQSKRSYDLVFKPLATRVEAEVDKLNLSNVALGDRQSLDRCDARLRRASPIAAQGQPRETLRKRIEDYQRRKGSLSAEERKRLYGELVGAFIEQPLSIPTIVTSGSLRRLDMISGLAENDPLPSSEHIQSLCNELLELDGLVLSSIRTSAIQARIQSGATPNA